MVNSTNEIGRLMKNTNSYLAISIYFVGDSLSPDKISRIIGVDPSNFFKKGEKKLPAHNKSAIYKKSIWILSIESNSKNISELFLELLKKVSTNTTELLSLPGVEEIYADVFIANTRQSEALGDSIDFSIDTDVIRMLAKLNIPIYFSVCNVAE